MDCLSCAFLRQTVLGPSAAAAPPVQDAQACVAIVADLGDEQPSASQATSPVKTPRKGRPRKDEVRQDIHDFIRKHRHGVYRITDASYSAKCTYHCLAREKDVRFWSQTCLAKLNGKNSHENSDKHRRGLVRLRGKGVLPEPSAGEVVGAIGEGEAVLQAAERTCSGCSPEDEPLLDIAKALETFVYHGQLHFVQAA